MTKFEEKDLRFEQIEKHEVMINLRQSYPDIEELQGTIMEAGLLNPLTVWGVACEPTEMPWGETVEERYFLVAGFRRLKAIERIKKHEDPTLFETIPVRIYRGDAEGARLINMVENVQRNNLNPLEVAQGLILLRDDHKLSQTEMAARLGKSQPWVSRTLDFVESKEVTKELKKAVKDNLLPFWLAVKVGTFKKEVQIKLSKRLKTASEKGVLDEELKKVKKEVKQNKKKSTRAVADIRAKLESYSEMNPEDLSDAQNLHRAGIMKGLCYALNKDLSEQDWENFDPKEWFKEDWLTE